MSSPPLSSFKKNAEEADEPINVDISYRIIQQVSSQLYTNPRRAIEELVCNSYDAEARECYVETPGAEDEPLLVLDNGHSMDRKGLDWLWTVAESPKAKNGQNRINQSRKQIGKFGVGKLAAYSLGGKLTHIAHTDGTTRAVTVDERRLSDEGNDVEEPPNFPVYELSEQDARAYLEPYFDEIPNPYEQNWGTWTLAIVEDLHEGSVGSALQPQYLDQMIRTAIPISADFTVYRDGKQLKKPEFDIDEQYTTILLNDEFIEWFEDDLQSFWEQRKNFDEISDVPSELYKCKISKAENHLNTDEEVKALDVPNLGPVWGKATIYEDTITRGKREERGFQEHGFKVTVKGKHLNRHDPLFGISQRSHKYWNKFLAEIEMPGLDDAILVQRNDVNENRVETQVARRLLKSIFNFARTEAKNLEEDEEYEPKSFGERLNVYSPFDVAEAVEGLTGEYPSEDFDELEVKAGSFNEDDRPVLYKDGEIIINEEHPFFRSLSNENGYTNFRKTIGEAVAGNLLTKGYFEKHDVPTALIDASEEMYDDILRSAAEYHQDETKYLKKRLKEASYEGDDPFERAIVSAFRSLKLASRHYGASGDPDGKIAIPQGREDHFLVSIEAKGKRDGKVVDHTNARASSVSRHRDGEGCDHAIIVARDFQLRGDSEDENSVFLDEIEREEGVTLLRLDALIRLIEEHKENRFRHSQIRDILTSGKHPDEMCQRIKRVAHESPDNDLLQVILQEGWECQREKGIRPSAGYLSGTPRIQEMAERVLEQEDRSRSAREVVAEIIRSLRHLTGEKVKVYDAGHEFELDASPKTILDEMSEGADDMGHYNSELDDF